MPQEKLIKKTIRNLRRGLNFAPLNEADAGLDPFKLFEKWMVLAVKKELFEPNAMTLSTASSQGKTTARTVLLKDYSPEGFTFFTNYNSRKGKNLNLNPQASLVFYWGSLSRQVLIEGKVKKLSRAASREYFESRPRGSQIAAYASNQSHVVNGRRELKKIFEATAKKFRGQPIPCPDYWGGFMLIPSRIEFWQGRPDRLHDRLCYSKKTQGTWKRVRLAP